jgi:hypothetical protein
MKKEVSIVFFLLFLHLTAKAVEVKVDHVFYNADSDTQTAVVIRVTGCLSPRVRFEGKKVFSM